MNRNWLFQHGPRIAILVVVTTAMVLARRDLIPLWIFYALLIAMHVWIFSRIGLRIYKWTRNRNN